MEIGRVKKAVRMPQCSKLVGSHKCCKHEQLTGPQLTHRLLVFLAGDFLDSSAHGACYAHFAWHGMRTWHSGPDGSGPVSGEAEALAWRLAQLQEEIRGQEALSRSAQQEACAREGEVQALRRLEAFSSKLGTSGCEAERALSQAELQAEAAGSAAEEAAAALRAAQAEEAAEAPLRACVAAQREALLEVACACEHESLERDQLEKAMERLADRLEGPTRVPAGPERRDVRPGKTYWDRAPFLSMDGLQCARWKAELNAEEAESQRLSALVRSRDKARPNRDQKEECREREVVQQPTRQANLTTLALLQLPEERLHTGDRLLSDPLEGLDSAQMKAALVQDLALMQKLQQVKRELDSRCDQERRCHASLQRRLAKAEKKGHGF